MADEMSWAVVLWVKCGRIEAILLSSRYAARHTLLKCCCIDSVWSRWTPRFLTENLNGMRLPPMSTLSLPTELRWEVDAMGRTLHLVWACCYTPSLQDFQCRSGYHREETETDQEEPPLTNAYHQHICGNPTHGNISSHRGAESTMWTELAQGPNPAEPQTEGGWERKRRQPSQTVHGPLSRMQTSKAQCQKYQMWSQASVTI